MERKKEEEKEDICLEQSSSTVWPKRLVNQGLQAVREFETGDFTENHIMDTAIPRLWSSHRVSRWALRPGSAFPYKFSNDQYDW